VDRALVITSLQAVEDRVALGARQIAKQRNVISRLEREGEDTTDAIAVLRQMQRAHESHLFHRERLRAELAALKAPKSRKTENPP
jgi:hypothetical protein